MASPALQALIDLVGDAKAGELYNAVVLEYTAHVRKHLVADSKPEKEKEFLGELLTKVETEAKQLHHALGVDLG